jgi:hypothetical protein
MSSTLAVVTLVIGGNIAITTACGWCLTRSAPKIEGEPWFVSLHHPAVNVAHDAVLAGYFLLCFGIIQYLLLAMAPRPSDASGLSIVLELLPSIGIIGVFLVYASSMRKISAGHVASERTRNSDVLMRRSALSPSETRRLWVERAEGLGKRYQRKLNWALRVSSVGLAAEAWQLASGTYVDPTAQMQRVKPLAGPMLLWVSRRDRARGNSAKTSDQADRQAPPQDREAPRPAEQDLRSYPG